MSDEIRQQAKAAGIKSWHVKKIENLKKELACIEAIENELIMPKVVKPKKKPKGLDIGIDEQSSKFFKTIGLKSEWLSSLANQYNFSRFQYIPKFKAFRCYIDGNHVDWIDVNDLSMLNGGQKLTEIKLKHQALPAERQVIKMPWRDNTRIKINDPSMR
ncbi:MAG: hypothetical protein GY829_12470 [Gammaproteobacteria bacterium]|nr:hypothetical protein [Gammaproteobacteria bacterium]